MAQDGSNKFCRISELRIGAVARDGRTVVDDLYATMPFKVMRALPVDADELCGVTAQECAAGPLSRPAQVMVMSTSAGIMAGDDQLLDVSVGTGAVLQMTTQAFEKIHKMDSGGSARRETHLHVAAGSYLDYHPQPTIPFADSDYASVTEIDLADATSRLAYEEVLSCGRVARGERFEYRSYRNHVTIRVAGSPIYLDNAVWDPARMPMESTGLFEGFSHLANLVLVNLEVGDSAFAAARDYLRGETGVIGAAAGSPVGAAEGEELVAGGITRLASGDVCVRLLGHRAQRLTDVLAHVRALLG